MNNDYFKLSQKYVNDLSISNDLKNNMGLEEFAKQNPSYYLKYPSIFNEVFDVDKEKVDSLCISGFLYYRSMMSTDLLYDEEIDKNSKYYTYLPIIISTCQEESIKLLTHIFGLSSEFWKFWNLRKGEFLRAMQIEKKLNLNKIPFDINIYYDLAEKKSAIGKIAIDSLYLLSGKNLTTEYETLLEAHRCFSIGLQLSDDFQDFYEDLEKGQTNWLINKLELDLSNAGKCMADYKPAVLAKLIYIRGTAEKALNLANEFYQKSQQKLSSINKDTNEFYEIIKERITEAKQTKQQIQEYMAILKKKIELFSIKKSVYKKVSLTEYPNHETAMAIDLINKIIRDANSEFSELKHVMYLGADEGFENEHSVHVGDVFQRALLLDILCDINNEFDFETIRTLIKDETKYLLNQKLERGVGGWSYFPTVKEIAPDIDDLGQILQCFSRTNNENYIDEFIVPLLKVYFDNNYITQSGGLETWIVPQSNQSKLEHTQEHFNSTKWGKGPDNEVMANFLYGLSLSNCNEYDQQLKDGINYLLEAQSKEGFWKSRWYYGNYYGTYTCLRLFKKHNLENDQIQKAIDYILESQNDDGGWPNDKEESSVLGSSFALLSLGLFPFDSISEEAISLGMKYLKHTFLSNRNTCEAEHFIIPKGGQPYKSKTITMGYAIKAILAHTSKMKAYG